MIKIYLFEFQCIKKNDMLKYVKIIALYYINRLHLYQQKQKQINLNIKI